jgi:signal transduction histidine kinase
MKLAMDLLGPVRSRCVWTVVGALSLAVLVVYIDLFTWVELNVSIFYGLPVILTVTARNRWLIWCLALFLVCMAFVVYFQQIPPGAFSLTEPFFLDRVLAAVTVITTAGLLHARTLALDKLEMQARSLQDRNEQVESANRELLRNKELITRQNEELERLRLEAEEASGRKTRLLASASHDIRTPVSSINVLAELIYHTAKDPSRCAEVLGLANTLQVSAQSLVELVSDVLDFSSFDSGRVEFHEQAFSLNELLTDECSGLRLPAEAKNLQLTVETGRAAVWLQADRAKLGRVVRNLVSNAIKFTYLGGVTVTAGRTTECDVLICVSDTGVGIGPADLGRVFDEFAQLGNSGHDGNKGWGLGLAICRRIVAGMGGEITVESRPNQGSAFSVRLPSSCVLDKTRVAVSS